MLTIKSLINKARNNSKDQTAEFKKDKTTYSVSISADGRSVVRVDGRRVSAKAAQDQLNSQNVAKYKHRGENYAVKLTDKTNWFSEISVQGVRWYDNFTNCYHKVYISVLIGNEWHELGGFEEMRAGYDRHYLVTAGEWLIANGYLEAPEGAVVSDWAVREALNITHYVTDVKRKRDM